MAELIGIISRASNRYGDKLIDFMERYHLHGLMEATEAQALEYIRTEGLL